VVQLDDYLAGLLEHLKTSLRSEGQGVSLVYDVPAVPLATDASINLGVVVTEWVTNAFKYAYPDGVGEVRVTVRELPDGMLELAVEDDGVGRAEGAPAKGTGLGTKIVTAMATSMKATIDYPAGRQGTSARLTFPRGS
jgi:two-component sensor histidine kinase